MTRPAPLLCFSPSSLTAEDAVPGLGPVQGPKAVVPESAWVSLGDEVGEKSHLIGRRASGDQGVSVELCSMGAKAWVEAPQAGC